MKEHGSIKPIWDTESNAGLEELPTTAYTNILKVGEGNYISPKAVADFNVRNLVALLGGGVDKWFIYHGFVPNRMDRYEQATLFEHDGAPICLALLPMP